ncbi:MAG: hypothetical protein NVS4B7_13590 [Ktedonobacteraceae bacterium]
MITQILVVYWAIVFVFLTVMFLLLIINLLTLPSLHRPTNAIGDQYHPVGILPGRQVKTGNAPHISILVPARNEERCIEACIRSLVAQTWPDLEILVLNDNSTDATASIIQRIIDELALSQTGRLRLLQGKALPQGWIGKNFACHQLAQEARGDYLLFTDADTVHEATMVAAVLACIQRFGVKLLTAQPEFVLGSLSEGLVIPLLNFTIMTLLPVALVYRRPEPSLATGNGQLLCFHRSAYNAVGGHASVKGKILEDVLLARAVKTAGYRMIFVDALDFTRCRMYSSFTEVWQGFSKNLFAFYNYSLCFALIALLLNLALFVVPPLLALIALLFHLSLNLLAPGLGAYALAVLMRVMLTVRFTRHRQSLMPLLWLSLLHPLSITLEGLILLNSSYQHYRYKEVAWKGRYYKV